MLLCSTGVLDENGGIDRGVLGPIVFSDQVSSHFKLPLRAYNLS